MEASIEQLPGKINQYYHMLGADEKNNTKYTVAYLLTSAVSLDGANSGNT